MSSMKRVKWEEKRRRKKKKQRKRSGNMTKKSDLNQLGTTNVDTQKKRQIIEKIVQHNKQLEAGSVPPPQSTRSTIPNIYEVFMPGPTSAQQQVPAQEPISLQDLANGANLEMPPYDGPEMELPLDGDTLMYELEAYGNEPGPEEFVESEHNGEYEQLIRNSLKLFRIPESTHLMAVVVDKRDELNKHEMVRCVGEPIGGYAYDMTHDAYYIRCCEYLDLGSIPVSYKMAMPNSNWVEFVALPDELLERCLTMQQKRSLTQFKERYRDERYSIQFLQSIDC